MDKSRILPPSPSFEIMIDSNLEPINSLISKSRVSIFYKYENRNYGYITDDFANILESKIAWTPVVGLYNLNQQDFTSHNEDRNTASMYGLVPPNHNPAWEKKIDKDGVEREYFTVDVYLYTGRYDIAKEIVGKSQSLEFDMDSITGDWYKTNNGEYYFYTNADFIGLCVLGTNVEPAFEGAAFFNFVNELSQQEEFKDISSAQLVESLSNFMLSEDSKKAQTVGGNDLMELNKAMFSKDEKINKVWFAVNNNFEKNEMTAVVTEVGEDAIVVYNLTDNTFKKVAYSIQEENVVLGDAEPVEVVASAQLKDYSAEIEGNKEKIAEFEAKILELDATVDTYKLDAERISGELIEAQNALVEYNLEKAEALKADKEAMIAEYATQLDETDLEPIKNELSNFSLVELEKELIYTAHKKNSTTPDSRIPSSFRKEDNGESITAILDRYKNKRETL